MKTILKNSLALLTAAALLGTAAHASTVTYDITINTAALASNPTDGPYYLDFQLTHGSGTIGNTATISDINLVNGSAIGSAMDYSQGGTTSGNLDSLVTLSDTNGGFLAGFNQEIATSTSEITFALTLTQNSSGPTPDGFGIAIDDNTTYQMPTTNPDGGVSLIQFNLGNATGFPKTTYTYGEIDASTYDIYDPNFTGVISAQVPEPASWALLLAGVAALGVLARRRLRA